LSEHQGESPVVLVFYPLAFSPTCSHQLPDLQQRIPEIEAMGAVVYGISIDSHWSNTAFARSLGLTFPLLSDFKRETSAAYGVLLPSGISSRATFVVGKDGRLLFADVPEKLEDLERVPNPDDVLAALAKA
jgi:peroxiredoxin (alkyl hydroperoxide reductase subunit C)